MHFADLIRFLRIGSIYMNRQPGAIVLNIAVGGVILLQWTNIYLYIIYINYMLTFQADYLRRVNFGSDLLRASPN